MNNLPDEVLQLVFYDLDDPTPLTRTNRRFLVFSQDPYVRAHYFLARYSRLQALYFALARGKLLTPRVLDILLASGAHLSRYLVQVAFHHFFYSQSHFIKPSMPWVRHVPLATFSYFLSLAAEKYGDIPRAKGEDDGALFATFIKEAKFPPESQRVSWETIRDIFENYHFIPFCPRDPLMVQFPLALAIEPRLLPYAVANGFHMDAKYRDFVFRKMFERTAAPVSEHAEEIVANVRELCRLDPDMFVTRTVAAEVCLEPKTNEAAYRALKQLDRTGDLPFALSELVQDVIKLFSRARAITTAQTAQTLTQLYTDFLAPPPTSSSASSSSLSASSSTSARAPLDPTVRRAMLLTVFAADPPVPPAALAGRLAPLRLGPFTVNDAADVLLSAFVEKPGPVMDYLRREGTSQADEATASSFFARTGGSGKEGGRRVTAAEVRALAEEVAVRCLVREGKGKTLKRLCDAYPNVRGRIVQAVLGEHTQSVQKELSEGGAGRGRHAKLAKQMGGVVSCELEESDSDGEGGRYELIRDSEDDDGHEMEDGGDDDDDDDDDMEMWADKVGTDAARRNLGAIGLEPLSTMIRRDEVQGTRGRRRYFQPYYGAIGTGSSSRLPPDAHSVARWIKGEFGALSSVTATFLTHAILNGNNSILNSYLHPIGAPVTPVPITLKHFRAMAALGTASGDYYMYERIKQGAPFYATEDDYLSGQDAARFLFKKLEKGKGMDKGKGKAADTGTAASGWPRVKAEPVEARVAVKGESTSPPRGRKRPRRSAAAAVHSYAVPDSDDEAIAAAEDREDEFAEYRRGISKENSKGKGVETGLSVRGVGQGSLGSYTRRSSASTGRRRSKLEKEKGEGEKLRVPKSDFFRSLTTHLRSLRVLETEQRVFRRAGGVEGGDSDAEDDEYVVQKAPRTKKRRTNGCRPPRKSEPRTNKRTHK
ncbi:hypothetical protein B0H11DRAFT_415511 [Mycena galericulata]|nr:hypothetical protein B0H11DRAFT_415511 [Mycena galericulata]